MTCCVLSLKLHKQMTDTEKVALAKQLVPCPACDDVLVVTDDVSRYVHENYPDKVRYPCFGKHRQLILE